MLSNSGMEKQNFWESLLQFSVSRDSLEIQKP